MKLGEQDPFNSGARLVTRPKAVAKRFDDVIGGNAEVRRAVFNHLGDSVEHAGHSPERRISFFEAANAVKMAKEFVGAVDEMNDHGARGQRSEVRSQKSEVRSQKSEVRSQQSMNLFPCLHNTIQLQTPDSPFSILDFTTRAER